MMKERFSPKTLSDITGVSIRTLHYYHEKGVTRATTNEC